MVEAAAAGVRYILDVLLYCVKADAVSPRPAGTPLPCPDGQRGELVVCAHRSMRTMLSFSCLLYMCVCVCVSGA
jgi:hypothetical protein